MVYGEIKADYESVLSTINNGSLAEKVLSLLCLIDMENSQRLSPWGRVKP